MFRKFAQGAVIVAAFAAGPCVSLASDADVIRETKDRADIEVMIWHYIRALDTHDADLYPTFFTEDGTLCCEHNHVYKGHAEIRTIVEDAIKHNAELKAQGKPVPQLWHPIFNFHIEFRDKDHAHVDSYWFTTFADNPPNGSPRITLVGRDEDEVVRVNGKWLFKSRNVFP
jgi:hypothetical protein